MSQQFIAAIAGSAGSHERLLEFFDHTPHDDVSYVILQHLPMNWRSRLASILSRHSLLDVKEIRNGMVLRKDTIYVAPAGCYVTIRQDIFAVKDRSGNVTETADTFMTSLAMNSRERSIGIVIEGILNDGTEGLRAIHQVGGLTMVQHPSTCKFCGMPESAIRAGVVDKIAGVREMPQLIQEHVSRMSPLFEKKIS